MRPFAYLLVPFVAVVACGDNSLIPDAGPDGPIMPACSDQRDNDGDGLVDYPNDPGCTLPHEDSEHDDCPRGAWCAQCSDGKDNDGNGRLDFPNDTGCTSAADAIEFTLDPNRCGPGTTIKPLPASGMDLGGLLGTTAMVESPCGGGNGLPGIAYVFHVLRPTVMTATTDDSQTMIDTILDLRAATCSDAGAELACNDDAVPNVASNRRSTLTRALGIGTYYLFVHGKTATDTGMYALRVTFEPGEGTKCSMDEHCGPGLVCRVPVGETAMVCTGPVCSDGRDDDADGKIDFPLDPGCTSATDDDETDGCSIAPTDPACPACGNGLDDDDDGAIDYPADPNCVSAATTSESCQETDELIIATTPQVMGTTIGATDDYRPPPGSYNNHLCSITGTHTAPDRIVALDLPAMKMLDLRLNPVGYDSTHVLLGPSCMGAPIDCSDNPNAMNVTNLTAGRYYLVVDGYSSGSGTFTLNIHGKIKAGESCEMALALSGAISCEDGYACDGTLGSRTCVPTACNDGLDNNSDGTIDYPADPGCTSISDTSEDTVCPGTTCPVCADGLDNDNDGAIDYPADTSCASASATSESCTQSEPIPQITQMVTTGSTTGLVNDYKPTCSSSTHTAPDQALELVLPPMATLSLNLAGFDTAHTLLDSTCGGTPIACSDPPLMTRTNVPAGLYYVVVDGWGTGHGPWTLTTTGTVAPGGSCEGALFQSGAFTCTAGYACGGTPGMRTCIVAQCNDGADNNNDGRTDYPADPGCTSSSDDSEDTVCPGSSCPVCSDGIDNDNDGSIDYPMDTSCLAASDTSEACKQSEPVIPITQMVTTGNTAGLVNDYKPTCSSSSHTAPDQALELDIPAMATLNLNLSGFDGAHALHDSTCGGTAIACSDPEMMTRTNVAAGRYYVIVDGWGSGSGPWTLTTTGTVAPGASCEGALFQSGAFTCTAGYACGGTPGTQTCIPAACNDGLDNNSDGLIDYPADPGCDTISDSVEDTVCPGPACPVCSDGIDNDNDGQIDWPMDTSCNAASGTTEHCKTSEPITVITAMVTTGNTAGLVNDYKPSCSSSSHSAPDQLLQLDVPLMASLSLNLTGFDGAHALLNSTCSGNAIACSDPPLMTTTNLAAGRYYVVVDGWGSGSGPWTLTTTGTVAAGGSCEGALFQAGAFSCVAGTSCIGMPGMRICM